MENTAPNTNNFLNWVEIKNFKSIKDLRLDCKRVNVFIGKPNVGKSNILEGLGLLGPIFGYSKENYFSDIIRYRDFSDVFNDNNTKSPILIKSDKTVSVLKSLPVLSQPFALLNSDANWFAINEDIVMTNPGHLHKNGQWIPEIYRGEFDPYYPIYLPLSQDGKNDRGHDPSSKDFYDGFERRLMVKKYDYKYLAEYSDIWLDYLLPPHGDNLFSIISQSKELRKEIGKLFEKDRLDFVLSTRERKFYLQKKVDDYVFLYPYSSIADTFQRFVFYSAAIESNTNSVIVLEEPEVHSFPPYVKALAHRIVYSETNQFFASTHSPYLLQTLIDELDESELAVYITYYKDYQTQVRQLTANELQEARDLSIDLFYNLSRYEPNA